MSDDAIDPTRENTAVVVARVFAQLIDFVAYIGLIVILAYVLVSLQIGGPRASPNVILLPTFLAILAYNSLLEAYWNGQTLGKRALGIKVVNRRGTDPSLGQAIVRNIPSVIPIGGTLAVIVALVSIASTDRRQRVFDIVAETYVVGMDVRRPTRSRSDTSDSGPYDFDDFGAR